MAATNQLCLVSMILGISGAASSVCCSLIALPLAIGAVVTGIIGLVQLRPGGQQGRGQAIAGIACGVAAVILQVTFLVFQFGFFAFSS